MIFQANANMFANVCHLSGSIQATMPSLNTEDYMLLQKANKKISDLKEDIRRLSDELKKRLFCPVSSK